MIIALALLLCGAAACAGVLLYRRHRPSGTAQGGTAPELLNQLPSDAPVLAYIDVQTLRKLHDSALSALLGLAGENPREDRDYQNFVRDTGFDYTRDLDKLAVAFWPSNWATTKNGQSNRTIAIADGRFDQAKIKAYALRNGKTVAMQGHTLYVVPGEPPVGLEFLAPTRIALASGPDAEHMLSASKPAPRDPASEQRIERVAGAPIFAVARTDKFPANLYEDLRTVPQFESLARNIEGLMLAGQPAGDLLHLTLDAECDSMANAAELSTLVDGLRLLGSMALADPKTRRQMTQQQTVFLVALLNQAKVSQQDRWVRLTLDVTPAMLGRLGATTAGSSENDGPWSVDKQDRHLVGGSRVSLGTKTSSHRISGADNRTVR